ncbi:DUF4440 domain-containing protein [Bosea psychrotolerans]|uniref:Uncharacterized protein DUF4440 n=1 Tax=Bosea psychrotolerans TaxID=1871628 RepID=A0A2S4M7W7_9HYPH|nr:nuclear transport factor 2 family protein [Bosea psychrotolerans]POR50804.1 uncharacterized protein DUF4440 [Bosea psychrotolerans]
MIRQLASVAMLALGLTGLAQAETQTETEIKALYEHFVSAQNARDLPRVRNALWDSPSFVWISDGKPFWGRDALIARMSAFQKAEIWSVMPDRTRARVVEVSPVSAVLYQPLRLTLGPRSNPKTIAFLVNVLCIRTPDGWRVAALYTTEENPN